MSAMASQINSLTIVYSIVYSGADQRKHQSTASLAFVWGIHRWPVNSPHKGPVTRKMFPFDDVIMTNFLWLFFAPTGSDVMIMNSKNTRYLCTPCGLLWLFLCPCYCQNYPDSKVHEAHIWTHLGPTGLRWVPCWPREPCYQGKHVCAYIYKRMNNMRVFICIICIVKALDVLPLAYRFRFRFRFTGFI